MKYPCQGPHCHTYSTKDRFIKKLKRLKGRNAYHTHSQGYRGPFTIFCTMQCQNDWISDNVDNIVAQRPITFNRERKFSEQTYHLSANNWLMKDGDGVDNE
jgi:hypothetical protein